MVHDEPYLTLAAIVYWTKLTVIIDRGPLPVRTSVPSFVKTPEVGLIANVVISWEPEFATKANRPVGSPVTEYAALPAGISVPNFNKAPVRELIEKVVTLLSSEFAVYAK